MADVELRAGSMGPILVDESDYAHPDCVMRREDIEDLVPQAGTGLTAAVTVVTNVGAFNGVVKKKTRIMTFTNGSLTGVTTETDWS